MVEDSLIERDRHDGDAVACLIEPQTLTAGVTTTPTIFMGGRVAAPRGGGYDRALFCILGGAANDAAATLDVVVHQCTQANDGGADAKVLAGLYGSKAITQVTAGTGYAALNQKWLIEVSTEEMDLDAYFCYLLLSITVSTADTWLLAVEAQRSGAAYEAVATTNITQAIGTTA
jgi:hypothetical protein